jgi:hypothetical protein
MWELLKQLYVDRAGSEIVHDESKDDPRVTDYLNRGINSPRGKAIEAAFEYARWIANQVKQLDGKREVVPGGFGTMPEIREMLEWQLSPENRSIEAFSVIGAYLSTILWIDKDWLAGNAERLFSLGGIERTPPSAEGWAAWNAYLVWSRPHFDFYSMFKSQFAQAVEQSTKVQPSEQSHEQPMDHLGEHLMLFYGRGQFGLDDDGGLLRKFLTASHPDIRRHAIRFIGESLQGDERIPEEFIKRFQQLWEFYWTATGKEDAADEPRAALFGPWFASGQFPVDWALDQLEQFVAIVPMPTGDDDIVEQIAKLAAMDPERSVRILDRMVRGDREGWHVSSWEDSARQILKTAQAAAGNAKEVAVSLINFLGRRGYPNFGNLLRTG